MSNDICAVCEEGISGFGYRGLKKGHTVLAVMTAKAGLDVNAPDFEDRLVEREEGTNKRVDILIQQGWEVVEVGRSCLVGDRL